MYSLNNKVIVITGASSGIGLAVAKLALKKGARVAVCARNIDKLKAALSAEAQEKLLYFMADVSNEMECRNFMEFVIKEWSAIDVLIANAGISMRALFNQADLKVLKELMDVNFWGAVYCTKYALPHIIKQKGVILGVSSVAGYRGLPARTGYSASKHALQGFLEALRTELLYDDVHVMWVSPGFTASNIRNVARSANGNLQQETPLEESKLMSAETCAEIIIHGIEYKKRTIVMTLQGKLAVWMNRLWASMADKLVYKHFASEPNSPLGRK
jgi:short-subunit dehydrogenase